MVARGAIVTIFLFLGVDEVTLFSPRNTEMPSPKRFFSRLPPTLTGNFPFRTSPKMLDILLPRVASKFPINNYPLIDRFLFISTSFPSSKPLCPL